MPGRKRLLQGKQLLDISFLSVQFFPEPHVVSLVQLKQLLLLAIGPFPDSVLNLKQVFLNPICQFCNMHLYSLEISVSLIPLEAEGNVQPSVACSGKSCQTHLPVSLLQLKEGDNLYFVAAIFHRTTWNSSAWVAGSWHEIPQGLCSVHHLTHWPELVSNASSSSIMRALMVHREN